MCRLSCCAQIEKRIPRSALHLKSSAIHILIIALRQTHTHIWMVTHATAVLDDIAASRARLTTNLNTLRGLDSEQKFDEVNLSVGHGEYRWCENVAYGCGMADVQVAWPLQYVSCLSQGVSHLCTKATLSHCHREIGLTSTMPSTAAGTSLMCANSHGCTILRLESDAGTWRHGCCDDGSSLVFGWCKSHPRYVRKLELGGIH